MTKAIELTTNGAASFVTDRVMGNTTSLHGYSELLVVILTTVTAMLEEGLLAPGPELVKFVEGQKTYPFAPGSMEAIAEAKRRRDALAKDDAAFEQATRRTP